MIIYNYLIIVNNSDDIFQNVQTVSLVCVVGWVWVEFGRYIKLSPATYICIEWKYFKRQSKCWFFANVPQDEELIIFVDRKKYFWQNYLIISGGLEILIWKYKSFKRSTKKHIVLDMLSSLKMSGIRTHPTYILYLFFILNSSISWIGQIWPQN